LAEIFIGDCKTSDIVYILQDVYFDDESAEVVISSLRLGDDHER